MKVQHVIEETLETKSFSLDFAGEPIPFLPGQFVNVTAQLQDGQRVRRSYSMASSPRDPEFLLTVKRMQGGLLSNFLCDHVNAGDVLNIRGPYGRFILEDDGRPLVFIAAGSGIVPFRSMWRYIRQTGSTAVFSLLYSSKSLRHVIYHDELSELSQAGYRIVHTITRNDDPSWTGCSRRIDREMLADFVQDFGRSLFYMCGPPDFCDCATQYLTELGVGRDRMRTEKYD
jgi:ferredoxin-NADP reductase